MSVLLSLLSGGLTGLLGKSIERYFDHKAKKLEAEIEERRFANQLKLAEIQGKAAVEVEDSKAFKASIESDKPLKFYEGTYTGWHKTLMILLDFSRGFIRIGLTAYLCILTTVVYFKAERIVDLDTILPIMAYDLVTMIINTVLYLTTTAVLWQFGSRGSNAPINRK